MASDPTMGEPSRAHESDDSTGARIGEQVLQRLRARRPSLWYRGEPVEDVTAHPAFKGGVQTLARLYDLQWENARVSLYESPTTGRKVGRSFMMARTREELRSVSDAMRVWAQYTCGMMGRAPDYLNRAITAYAAGSSPSGSWWSVMIRSTPSSRALRAASVPRMPQSTETMSPTPCSWSRSIAAGCRP